MKLALIGCGDIGCRIGKQMLEDGVEVHGFRRSADKLPEDFVKHSLDVHSDDSCKQLGDTAFDYAVITLTPDSFSKEAYEQTYVLGLRRILKFLNREQLKRVFWVSSTSVYGQSDGSWVNESSATNPERFSGQLQLAAEKELEVLNGLATVVRFSGIYREGTHRYVKQLKEGKLAAKAETDFYTNRIHVADCAGFLAHLIQNHQQGLSVDALYLANDNEPVSYETLVQWLADKYQLPLNEQADAVVARAGNKRCSNKRMLVTGYELKFPSYVDGFSSY